MIKMAEQTATTILPIWEEMLAMFWGYDAPDTVVHPVIRSARALSALHREHPSEASRESKRFRQRRDKLVYDIDNWVAGYIRHTDGIGVAVDRIAMFGVRAQELLADDPNFRIDLTLLSTTWSGMAATAEGGRCAASRSSDSP
ncbi:hypothetical protein AB0C34_18145 [Nocardia sp. NPDC049220]|uniref:hypothetical protein n=1 Tax=Nocardia sp. NPDC049220 TaxID=3155273 RepID=UPI0033C69496